MSFTAKDAKGAKVNPSEIALDCQLSQAWIDSVNDPHELHRIIQRPGTGTFALMAAAEKLSLTHEVDEQGILRPLR